MQPRKTLKQVFEETKIAPNEHKYIYYKENLLRKIGQNVYEIACGKSEISIYKFTENELAETCQEVFQEEIEILKNLFGY